MDRVDVKAWGEGGFERLERVALRVRGEAGEHAADLRVGRRGKLDNERTAEALEAVGDSANGT